MCKNTRIVIYRKRRKDPLLGMEAPYTWQQIPILAIPLKPTAPFQDPYPPNCPLPHFPSSCDTVLYIYRDDINIPKSSSVGHNSINSSIEADLSNRKFRKQQSDSK